jgi:hypothetical protein
MPETEIVPFVWNAEKEEAAQLVAEDKLTDPKIARRAKVSERTLYRWKVHPEFAARVAEHRAEYARIVRSRGIAIVENRVEAYNERWILMKTVITSRAARHAKRRKEGHDDTPEEALTGLVILEKTFGKNGVTEKWLVDTGLLAELRNHEQQAAKELGQWEEKSRVDVNVAELPDEDLERLAKG